MNRSYYKKLNQDVSNRGKKVGTNKQLITDISYRSFKLVKSVENLNIPDGIKWCYGYSNYINNQGRVSLSGAQIQSFQRGQIIFADFFGGFSEELTYDHNAVVLKATANGLIVAPITSSEKYFKSTNDKTLIKLSKRVKDKGNLLYDSTIRLDQLRYISRTRILRRHGLIRDKDVLEEISNKLVTYLAPVYVTGVNKALSDLKNNYDESIAREEVLNKRVTDTEQELLDVKKENEELKMLVDRYKKEYDK